MAGYKPCFGGGFLSKVWFFYQPKIQATSFKFGLVMAGESGLVKTGLVGLLGNRQECWCEKPAERLSCERVRNTVKNKDDAAQAIAMQMKHSTWLFCGNSGANSMNAKRMFYSQNHSQGQKKQTLSEEQRNTNYQPKPAQDENQKRPKFQRAWPQLVCGKFPPGWPCGWQRPDDAMECTFFVWAWRPEFIVVTGGLWNECGPFCAMQNGICYNLLKKTVSSTEGARPRSILWAINSPIKTFFAGSCGQSLFDQ